jgi:signal peptidase I
MMKNKWLLWAAPLTLIAVLWVAARITGALHIYKIPTPSSEPTIKTGSIIFTSILKKPEPGNTVTYKSEYVDTLNPYRQTGETILHRMVADEGDVLEMKEAVLYRNGKNFDADKNLLHNYITDEAVVASLPNFLELEKKGLLQQIGGAQYSIFLSTKEMIELNRQGKVLQKVISRKGDYYDGAFNWMKKDSVWTIDNFGPITIPKGFFFVMGDNRHNSLDSRYVGFIKKENFKGTVLNK